MHLCIIIYASMLSFICPGGVFCRYWYSINGKDAYEEKETLWTS